jgi:predicted PurR-regulated permease PerM
MSKITNKNKWVVIFSLVLIFLALIYITYSIINKQNNKFNESLNSNSSFSSSKNSSASNSLISSVQRPPSTWCGSTTPAGTPCSPVGIPAIDDSLVSPVTTKD